jgi:hypothetical protein
MSEVPHTRKGPPPPPTSSQSSSRLAMAALEHSTTAHVPPRSLTPANNFWTCRPGGVVDGTLYLPAIESGQGRRCPCSLHQFDWFTGSVYSGIKTISIRVLVHPDDDNCDLPTLHPMHDSSHWYRAHCIIYGTRSQQAGAEAHPFLLNLATPPSNTTISIRPPPA